MTNLNPADQAVHVPAAFINAIREEGTKTEACNWLQTTWNESCAKDAKLAELVEALRPFARMGRIFAHPRYDVLVGVQQKATFTIAEFRAARSVLE